MKKKLKKLILPASVLVASQAIALGLGNLQVNSVLEETLKGEIPLLLDGSENVDSIKVSLASAADYKRVGLDKSYVPSNIQVSIGDDNDGKYIKISSKGPVSEPIVSLLVSVDWSNGHLLREYTLLLDPPAYAIQTQENYSQPVQTQTYTQTKPIESTVETDPEIVETETEVIAEPETIIEPEVVAEAEEVTEVSDDSISYIPNQLTVSAGDTLWRIASNNSNGYSPQQVMVAIFNNNPEAFNNNDMNQLKKGAVLEMPTSDQLASIDYRAALDEVKSQTQNWSSLQTEEDNTDLYTEETTVDTTSDYGIEIVPPKDGDESSDTSTAGTIDTDSTTEELNRTQEELVNAELEKQELADKVKDLEEIVKEQEQALDVQDDDLATVQDVLANIDEESTDDEVADSTEETEEVEVVEDSEQIDDSDAVNSEDSEVWNTDEASDNAESEANDTVANETTEEVIIEETDDGGSDEISIVDVEEINTDTQDSTPEQTPVEQVETQEVSKPQSFMDKVMAYKNEGLIGLGVLLLGLFGFLFMRRKGERIESDDFLDNITTPADDASEDLENNIDEISESVEETIEDVADEVEDTFDNVTQDSSLADEVDEAVSDSVTELNLSNLDDEFAKEMDDIDEAVEDVEDEFDDTFDLDFNDEPEVDVMDESEDDGEFNLDDLDELDLSEEDEDTDELGDIEYDTEGLQEAISGLKKDEVVDDLQETVSDIDSQVDNLVDSFDDELVETIDEAEDFSLYLDLDIDEESEISSDSDVDSFTSEIDAIVDTIEHDVRDVEDKLEEQGYDLDDNAMDLDDSSLDLDVPDEFDELDTVSEKEFDLGFDLEESGDDAIDTKLDLAKAYFEMGDVDGAKQMVMEIIEEGNDEQISKANELKNEIEGS